MITKEKIKQFIEEISEDKIVKKNLYRESWISGSSTTVYPIIIWSDSVEFQWKDNRNIYDKFIERIVKKYSSLIKYGYFRKSDGSCPSCIVFKLKEQQL